MSLYGTRIKPPSECPEGKLRVPGAELVHRKKRMFTDVLCVDQITSPLLQLAVDNRSPFLIPRIYLPHQRCCCATPLHSGLVPRPTKHYLRTLDRLTQNECWARGAFAPPRGSAPATKKRYDPEACVAVLSATDTCYVNREELFVRGFSDATLDAVDVFRCTGRIPEGLNATSDQNSNGLP